MAEQIITKEYLNELFEYRDGELYWKIPTKGHSVGMLAGSVNKLKYRAIKINSKLYKAHRLIYLMFNGELPKMIDHIDNNPSNNRIENLRPANTSLNRQNAKINKNNTSGVKGVSWDSQAGRWKARIWSNKKTHTIGLFNTIAEAEKVVKSARERLHMDFARHS